jgi:adenylate kinase family enzyme
MDGTPVFRYNTFQKNLDPVLQIFEQRGGVVVDIDANQAPKQVLAQVAKVYDYVTLPQVVA